MEWRLVLTCLFYKKGKGSSGIDGKLLDLFD